MSIHKRKIQSTTPFIGVFKPPNKSTPIGLYTCNTSPFLPSNPIPSITHSLSSTNYISPLSQPSRTTPTHPSRASCLPTAKDILSPNPTPLPWPFNSGPPRPRPHGFHFSLRKPLHLLSHSSTTKKRISKHGPLALLISKKK